MTEETQTVDTFEPVELGPEASTHLARLNSDREAHARRFTVLNAQALAAQAASRAIQVEMGVYVAETLYEHGLNRENFNVELTGDKAFIVRKPAKEPAP